MGKWWIMYKRLMRIFCIYSTIRKDRMSTSKKYLFIVGQKALHQGNSVILENRLPQEYSELSSKPLYGLNIRRHSARQWHFMVKFLVKQCRDAKRLLNMNRFTPKKTVLCQYPRWGHIKFDIYKLTVQGLVITAKVGSMSSQVIANPLQSEVHWMMRLRWIWACLKMGPHGPMVSHHFPD